MNDDAPVYTTKHHEELFNRTLGYAGQVGAARAIIAGLLASTGVDRSSWDRQARRWLEETAPRESQ